MKYKNYEITRDDERNWKLVRRDMAIADRDIKKKNGEIVHQKGEAYEKETFKGFFGEIQSAIGAIVSDLAGRDCETLDDLRQQIKELKAEFAQLGFKQA